jgi:hypothetical protein
MDIQKVIADSMAYARADSHRRTIREMIGDFIETKNAGLPLGGLGRGVVQATKFLGRQGKELLKPLPSPERLPVTPGSPQNKAYNMMIREMGDAVRKTDGRFSGGFYSGVSKRPLTAAAMRGLAGYTLGNSLNPYDQPMVGQNGEQIEPGWLRRYGLPAFGAIGASLGFSPRFLAGLAKRSLTPSGKRIMSNVVTQPIVRLGATSALGDIGEAVNHAVGNQALDGKIKPTLMVAGGLSGLRPARQMLLSKYPKLQIPLDKVPASIKPWVEGTGKGLTGLVNGVGPLSRVTGGPAATRSNWVLPAASTAFANWFLLPEARAYTDNSQKLLQREAAKYNQTHPNTGAGAEEKIPWRDLPINFFTPRLYKKLQQLKQINRTAGEIYKVTDK